MENDLSEIFKRLKLLLQKYDKVFVSKINDEKHFDLWSNKEFIFEGKIKKEMFFASVEVQKNDVAFHFIPIYTNSNLIDELQPNLKSKLKGKSCFHFKNLNRELENEIADALEKGFQIFKQKDWI